MTDFRARGTIMGPAGLTAVFGMGTGVAPPVWSPGKRPAGGQARRPRVDAVVGHAVAIDSVGGSWHDPSAASDAAIVVGIVDRCLGCAHAGPSVRRASWSRRRRVGVVKPLGC